MAITGVRYKGRWSPKVLAPFGYDKQGEVKVVPDDVSEADAKLWAKTWPGAFELVEAEPTERSVDKPPKHRMREAPARKRGKGK